MLYEYETDLSVILNGYERWLLCFFVIAVFALGMIWAFSKRKDASENPGLYPFHYKLVNKKSPSFTTRIYAGFACALLFFSVFTVYTAKSFLFEPLYCTHCIKTEKFETVSGEVESFYTWSSGITESFIIDGVNFQYSENRPCGYCKTSESGGVVYENGQRLKISYVPLFGENIIVYIESI